MWLFSAELVKRRIFKSIKTSRGKSKAHNQHDLSNCRRARRDKGKINSEKLNKLEKGTLCECLLKSRTNSHIFSLWAWINTNDCKRSWLFWNITSGSLDLDSGNLTHYRDLTWVGCQSSTSLGTVANPDLLLSIALWCIDFICFFQHTESF